MPMHFSTRAWCARLLVLCAAFNFGCGASAQGVTASGLSAQSAPSPRVTVLSPQLIIPGLDRARTVRIYVPPGYASSVKRYPVLYMHDGQNLFAGATAHAGQWDVDDTLDGLARSQGLELIVVAIDNGEVHRVTELNPWDNARFGKGEGRLYMDFIVSVLKPLVDRQYRTLPGREHTGVMGSSLGGLVSHYAILQYPEVFSKAGIFSPAYWVGPEVFELAATQPLPTDARLAMYMGGGEGDEAVNDFRRMLEQLQAKAKPGPKLWIKWTPGAQHNEGAWRAEFASAVSWMYASAH